jgi:Rad3-related DNA helicase
MKTQSAKINLRSVPCQCSLQGAIEDGYSRLEDLMSECQEIVDNASEGLSQTQRIQTLEETASNLSGADSQPDVPEGLSEVVVSYTEDRRKSKSHSRATRCAEACELLSAAVAAIQEWSDASEDVELKDEAEQLCSEIEDMISNAEYSEFPGMFG